VDSPPKPLPACGTRPSKKPVYPREIAGLILIAVLILTSIPYWQAISWNIR